MSIRKIHRDKDGKRHDYWAGWNQDWIVNSQAVGAGSHSLEYLAPYVFKMAISNSRIIKVEDRKVFFKYRKPKSNRWRTMVLDVMEFMRRFLQHVLPTGFMKVRISFNPVCYLKGYPVILPLRYHSLLGFWREDRVLLSIHDEQELLWIGRQDAAGSDDCL